MIQDKSNLVGDVNLAMIKYFGDDVLRIQHALKVHAYASVIGCKEIEDHEQQLILELSAILHDIGIKESERKYNSSSAKYQELEGQAVGREILETFEVSQRVIDKVTFIIGHHHTYSAINSTAFQILVEADFFVNAFEDAYSSEKIRLVGEKILKTKTAIEILNSQF